MLAGLLIVLLLALCGWQVYRIQYPHGSGDNMTLSDWLDDPHRPTIDPNHQTHINEIKTFGAEAIPDLIHVYRNTPFDATWLPSKKQRLPWKNQRQKALAALVILSREHASEVDPFFTGILKHPKRGNMLIPMLGFAGPRYLGTLTNLLSHTAPSISIDALRSLSHLGTNAWMAPRQFVSVQRARTGALVMPDAELFQRFGKLPDSEVNLLIGFLNHRSEFVRKLTIRVLSNLPENRDQGQQPILNLASQPPDKSGVGKAAALALAKLDVPADKAVPVLLRRLEHALDAHVHELPFHENKHQVHVTDYLSALAHYESKATNAVDLIESKILISHVSRAMHDTFFHADSEHLLTNIRPELNAITGGTWHLLDAYETQGNKTTSGKLGLMDWLGDPTRDAIDLNDPEEIEFVLGLGKTAIPILMTEHLLTQSLPAPSSEVFALNGRRVPPARRPAYKQKTMTALALLGRRHSHLVDRFIATGSPGPSDVPWQAMMNHADLNIFTNAPNIETGLLSLVQRKSIESYDVGRRIAQYFVKFLPRNAQSITAIKNRLEAEPLKEDDPLLTELIPYAHALSLLGPNPDLLPLIDRKITVPLRRLLGSPETTGERAKQIDLQLNYLKYIRDALDPPPSP